jgi:gluconate 5-dehydrogenase
MKTDLFSMDGKVVVFTGGAGNLGQILVKKLLEYGATVSVPDIADRFDDSFAEYRSANKLHFIKADLSKSSEIQRMFAETKEKFGKIDVLVNCAAYGGGAGGKTAEFHVDKLSDEEWELGIEGTLDITFRCTREVIPYFDEIGGGNIVNFASMYGMIAPDFKMYGDIPASPPFYGAGKAGVIQFTRYCASQFAPRNIRVNSIAPGPFPNITPNSDMDFINRLRAKTMMGRTGKAEELCGALILLCSDASSFMTGTNIVVDGGMTEVV